MIKKILGSEPFLRGARFVCRAVGYISYDPIRYWNGFHDIAVDDPKFPDIEMGYT